MEGVLKTNDLVVFQSALGFDDSVGYLSNGGASAEKCVVTDEVDRGPQLSFFSLNAPQPLFSFPFSQIRLVDVTFLHLS